MKILNLIVYKIIMNMYNLLITEIITLMLQPGIRVFFFFFFDKAWLLLCIGHIILSDSNYVYKK